SRKPTPVLISAFPEPSRFSDSEMSVSPVLREIDADRDLLMRKFCGASGGGSIWSAEMQPSGVHRPRAATVVPKIRGPLKRKMGSLYGRARLLPALRRLRRHRPPSGEKVPDRADEGSSLSGRETPNVARAGKPLN